MDAGELSARVALKSRSATQDVNGREVVTYPTVATVPAKAEPIRGREYVAFQQAQSEIEMRFTIYYRSDVRADWRVEWRGQDYEIVGPPIDVGARREWSELMCRTAQT